MQQVNDNSTLKATHLVRHYQSTYLHPTKLTYGSHQRQLDTKCSHPTLLVCFGHFIHSKPGFHKTQHSEQFLPKPPNFKTDLLFQGCTGKGSRPLLRRRSGRSRDDPNHTATCLSTPDRSHCTDRVWRRTPQCLSHSLTQCRLPSSCRCNSTHRQRHTHTHTPTHTHPHTHTHTHTHTHLKNESQRW